VLSVEILTKSVPVARSEERTLSHAFRDALRLLRELIDGA
jgi:hypothetical protein